MGEANFDSEFDFPVFICYISKKTFLDDFEERPLATGGTRERGEHTGGLSLDDHFLSINILIILDSYDFRH
jgi:hypothetical protein